MGFMEEVKEAMERVRAQRAGQVVPKARAGPRTGEWWKRRPAPAVPGGAGGRTRMGVEGVVPGEVVPEFTLPSVSPWGVGGPWRGVAGVETGTVEDRRRDIGSRIREQAEELAAGVVTTLSDVDRDGVTRERGGVPGGGALLPAIVTGAQTLRTIERAGQKFIQDPQAALEEFRQRRRERSDELDEALAEIERRGMDAEPGQYGKIAAGNVASMGRDALRLGRAMEGEVVEEGKTPAESVWDISGLGRSATVERVQKQMGAAERARRGPVEPYEVPGFLERGGAKGLNAQGLLDLAVVVGRSGVGTPEQLQGAKAAVDSALGLVVTGWHDVKQLPGVGPGARIAEARGSDLLSLLQAPAWNVEEYLGTEWQRLPGGQGLWPLVNPQKHLDAEGKAEVDRIVEAWWEEYYAPTFREWYGTDPEKIRATAEPVQRWVASQLVLQTRRGKKPPLRDYAFATYGDRQPAEVEQALRRLAVGMGYSSYEAQRAGLDRLMAGEDLEVVIGGRGINVVDPSADDRAAFDAYVQGVRMREGEDAANAAADAIVQRGFIPGESDVANQFLFEYGLDPLNVLDVFDWVKAPAQVAEARAAGRFLDVAGAEDVARAAARADAMGSGVRLALKNADEVGSGGAEVGGLRKLWDKVNPLALTDRAKAERMAGTAFQVVTPGIFQVEDADEARAMLRVMVENPDALTDVMGRVPMSKAADEVRPLLARTLADADDFASLRGATFNRGAFAQELDSALIRNALDLTGAAGKEPTAYEKFVGGYRDFMSKFYLRTPGYAIRNAVGDTVTMAHDGLLSFDGSGKLDDFFKRFGPATRRVGGGAPAGSQVLTKGEGGWFGARVMEKITGGFGARIQNAEEMRYRRAFYTYLTRDALPEVWTADVVRAILPAGLTPEQADVVAREVAKGLNLQEFRAVVKRVASGEDLVDVGQWVDEPDILSVGLRMKLEGDLAGVVDADGVDVAVDAARAQVMEDVGKALAADPTPPGRRVWSDFEAVQDLVEEQGWLKVLGEDLGMDEAEIVKAQEGLAASLAEGERALRGIEEELAGRIGELDPDQAAALVRKTRADTGRMKMLARAEADRMRGEAWERIAAGDNAAAVWGWYFPEVNRLRVAEQDEVLARLQDGVGQLDRLAKGEDLETVLGGPAERVLDKALEQLRVMGLEVAERRKRLARLGVEEFEDFDRLLDSQRLVVDTAEAEAWRMLAMNPSRDGVDVVVSTQNGVDRLARAAAAEADTARVMMLLGKMSDAERREVADKVWRRWFTDAAKGWDLARAQLAELPMSEAGQLKALRALGWSDEAAAGLSPDMARAVLSEGVRWDPLLDGPEIPLDEVLEGTLTAVAGRTGLDLAQAGDWGSDEWRAIAAGADQLAQEAGDRASAAARLWAARRKEAEVALEAAEEAPKTVSSGMDLAYPQSLDDVVRSMGISPGGVQAMEPAQWAEVADYCEGRGQAALLLGDAYGRQSLAAQEALRLPELGAVGGQDVTVRVGRMTGREEVARVAEFGRQSKREAGGLIDWVLAEAGFTADEVGGLNFEQKKKLVQEIAEGDVIRTKGGRPARIGQVDPQRRHEVLHGLRQAGAPDFVGVEALKGAGGWPVVYKADLPGEARFLPSGEIAVGPKFRKLNADAQKAVLQHERAHGILTRTGATAGDELWRTGEALQVKEWSEAAPFAWFGGNKSIEEAAADALQAMMEDPDGLRAKSPQVYEWAAGQIEAAGVSEVSPTGIRGIAAEIAADPEMAVGYRWMELAEEARLRAGTQELEALRGRIQQQSHTLEDVVSGRYPVGVEGRGGRDFAAAKEQGLYTVVVNGTPIFARSEEDARPLVNYLEGGGQYGSREFSRLLGYSDDQIAEYERFLELSQGIDVGAPKQAFVVQPPGLYDAAGFPVSRRRVQKGRKVPGIRKAVEAAEAMVPDAARLQRGRASVGFEARQAYLAQRYADLMDMARARAGLIDDGARMGADVLDVPEGVVKAVTRKEGDIYLLDLLDDEGRKLRGLWFENWRDAKKAKAQADEVIKAGQQGRGIEVGTSWSLWGTEAIKRADGRAAAFGGYADPPTLADASVVMEQAQLDALEQIRDGAKGWVSGRGAGAELAPGVRRQLLDWVDGDLSKAWTERRTLAVEMARTAADYSLLDYSGDRRRIDDWLNLVFPYTFWRTRSARNWALRFASHPARLNAWRRYQDVVEKVQRESGRRGRFKGTVKIPTGELLPEWMGEGVYLDPSIAMPWAQALGAGWTPSDEPSGPIDRMYRVAQGFGLRPYGWLEWGAKYAGWIGKGQEDIGYFVPHTGAIQGLTALAGAGGPMGVDVEAGLRRGLGIPEREPWTGYRVSRMIANMAADDPALTDRALMAQELVRLVEAGELEWSEAFEGGGNVERLAQANGWAPEDVERAQVLLREAANRAAIERGMGAVGSFAAGVSPRIYPTGEQAQVGLEAEQRAAQYSPLTGRGGREALLAFREAHPEEVVRRMARTAVPAAAGEYEGMTPADVLAWRERDRQRDVINARYDAAVQGLLQREPWNKAGVQQIEEARRRELDALGGGGAVYAPSTYGAGPEEAREIRHQAVLGAVSAAMPKMADFTDEAGVVDWQGYDRAVGEFFADLPGRMAGDPQLAAIAAGARERVGVGVTVEREGRAGLPRLPVREERGASVEELLGGITREEVEAYWRRNDTELEALSRVWESEVYRPAWEEYHAAVDGGMDKGEAYERYIEKAGAVDAGDLIDAVMAAYPGRWTREELEAAYRGVEFPGVQDVSQMRKPAEQRELDEAKTQFWDFYNEQLPPGWRSGGAREYHLVQAILDAEARGTVTAEQYGRALEWLNQWRADNYGEDWREEDWAAARRMNDVFWTQVERRWPDVRDLQDQYFELDQAERRVFLDEHPELREYWDFRQAWGERYPLWAYFYLREQQEGGRGYASRGYYRRYARGGGRGYGGYDEFAYQARRVPRWGLYAPSPWEGALSGKRRRYRAEGVPWILRRWAPRD